MSGEDGDTFVLAGWAKADSVPIRDNREFAMIATFMNGSTTVNTSIVRFNPCADSTIEWQYAASPIVAKGAYDSIVIELAYDYNANTAYFDGVQLYKEEFGNSYTYDEDGNIISVKDVQSQTTFYEYEDNNLTAQNLPSGARLEYEYDEWHNVTKATSDTGVTYEFVYDSYGNNTSVSIVSEDIRLVSSANYSNDGNRLDYTTDAAGRVTTYGYNENTNVLEWVKYPADTDATSTEYTYDEMYRLARAETDVSTGGTLFAEYEYENDLLKSITTASTTYSFTYGDFALRSNIMIGDRTLASYTYTDRNNFLASLDYGNGDSVDYTYDKQGRVTQQTYEDGDTVTYKYDNSGALASITDSATGITTTYYYDYTDRLLRYAEKGSDFSHIVGYAYDAINNLTALVETINGTEYKTTYGYDDDNRVTSVGNGSASEAYTYDVYSRLHEKVTKNGDTTVLTDTFTYRKPITGTTSGQVETLSSAASGYNVTYTYTYDGNGNILSVSDGTNTTSYVYDSANQLLRENNQAAGKTWVYTYDNAGNILEKTKYAYTTGDLGAVQDTAAYTYGDTAWGDLLMEYDGRIITHDEIGNPLSDGVWTYTWEHGRQLSSMSSTSPVIITEQPEDYAGALGDTATFTVAAEGDGLTYQWQYSNDGGVVWDNSSASGNTTSTESIEILAHRNGQLHRCVVTDAMGHRAISQPGRIIVVSDAAVMSVTVQTLQITDQPDDYYGLYGDTATFTIAAEGEGLTYQWQYSNDGGASWWPSTTQDGTTNTQRISLIAQRVGQMYRCIVTDAGGNTVTSRTAEIKLATYGTWEFSYNTDGLRRERTNGTTTYSYIYNGSSLSQMNVDGNTLYFAYDASGTPMAVTYNGTNYYYATNLQGDVTAILDTSGTAVVEYTYDAWGNILTTTGSMADTLGAVNPLRYRGYVYDTETGLYYVSSRYYDPEIGRWINADSVIAGTGGSIQGYNMFAYCFNNPVNMADYSGNWPQWIEDTWEAIKDFFSPETDSQSGEFEDGIFRGSGSRTNGYSEVNWRLDDKIKSSGAHDGWIGVFGKASVNNASGKVGIGNHNLSVSLKGVVDGLTATAQAGLHYKNGFWGGGVKAKAAVLSGRATTEFNIFGWQVELGVSADVLAIGFEANVGIFPTTDGGKQLDARASFAPGLFGWGFIVRVKVPG